MQKLIEEISWNTIWNPCCNQFKEKIHKNGDELLRNIAQVWFISIVCILPSYGTAGSMIPWYLFCLFLCTAVPPAGFSIYIFINTTVTFIGTSGHSVQMSWIFVSTHIFYLFLRNSGHFYFTLIPCFVKCPIIKP